MGQSNNADQFRGTLPLDKELLQIVNKDLNSITNQKNKNKINKSIHIKNQNFISSNFKSTFISQDEGNKNIKDIITAIYINTIKKEIKTKPSLFTSLFDCDIIENENEDKYEYKNRILEKTNKLIKNDYSDEDNNVINGDSDYDENNKKMEKSNTKRSNYKLNNILKDNSNSKKQFHSTMGNEGTFRNNDKNKLVNTTEDINTTLSKIDSPNNVVKKFINDNDNQNNETNGFSNKKKLRKKKVKKNEDIIINVNLDIKELIKKDVLEKSKMPPKTRFNKAKQKPEEDYEYKQNIIKGKYNINDEEFLKYYDIMAQPNKISKERIRCREPKKKNQHHNFVDPGEPPKKNYKNHKK